MRQFLKLIITHFAITADVTIFAYMVHVWVLVVPNVSVLISHDIQNPVVSGQIQGTV